MAQQTAVEWLVYELERCGYFEINDRFPITVEQAIKIEKHQIKDAWENGFANGYDLGKFNDDCKPDDAEEYYNETFTSIQQSENPSAT